MSEVGTELDIEFLEKFVNSVSLDVDWVGLRYSSEISHSRRVRNGVPDSDGVVIESGVNLEVLHRGQFAYAGTSDVSEEGLKRSFQQARQMAEEGASQKVFAAEINLRPSVKGYYKSPRIKPLDRSSLQQITSFLLEADKSLFCSPKIVTRQAMAGIVELLTRFISSNGSNIHQDFLLVTQNYSVTAQDGGESQTRSLNGSFNRCYQVGMESFDAEKIFPQCERLGPQALELLEAENCPEDVRDLLVAPDQMTLQIHESIGHPLEYDRILGDERNYAGWSFIKPSDFGRLQYGSPLMTVSFDPTVSGEFATYAFDDGGAAASKEYLIKNGLLTRGLGGRDSQARIKLPGVANFRASSWNRAPIDRMANINLEPGRTPLHKMIEMTEKGLYVESNRSWSIDDYRNKFQFGCEYARLIEDGRLTKVVKNSNYRGATVSFWNSLKALGTAEEVEIFGSPFCGKGEPSQIIRVGHSSPPCLFSGVQVFGGEK